MFLLSQPVGSVIIFVFFVVRFHISFRGDIVVGFSDRGGSKVISGFFKKKSECLIRKYENVCVINEFIKQETKLKMLIN